MERNNTDNIEWSIIYYLMKLPCQSLLSTKVTYNFNMKQHIYLIFFVVFAPVIVT